MKSTISADIIKSTSLSVKDIVLLRAHLVRFQANVKQLFPGSWGRIIRGDGLECVLQKANQSLRAALMLKYLIKSFNAEYSNPAMVFKKYGVRIAMCVFHLVKKIRLPQVVGRLAVIMAPSVFCVYILHANEATYAVLDRGVNMLAQSIGSVVLACILISILAFGACLLLDVPRRLGTWILSR